LVRWEFVKHALALNRPALERADEGLALIEDQEVLLSEHIPDVPTRLGGIDLARSLIYDIIQKSIDDDLVGRFGKIEEDVLGAYWINASRIQLY
jgi:hypothetical protein